MLKDKRFYIIEDDPGNMAIISVLIRQHGGLAIQDVYNTYSPDALKRFMPLDMVLLDLMLRRGVTGYQVFDSLKADPELANIPVVIVSAADPAMEMGKAREKGFMGYIEKPIDQRSFPLILSSVLNGKPVWGELLETSGDGTG